ncbi:PREDICTED: disease resistance protein TAO1-like isoform X2 [Prunus mume]|uniref:Disease resistance protein TAO1-like isoform X2 n=1 Tax=Prunus mume TaxID=102107 RepID=A0ABM1LTK5_PRUMU|nr:PREDICTED: disease resistance protein TAO1-like isoform X2 [Prunus mume]
MDSSSSSSLPFPAPLREKYDVFLSFRGEDTRDTFTSHLHAALRRKNIETYIDYRLEKGDDIGPALLEAIEKSKIAIVIFSKDYASSTWCLKELVHILGCKKSYGQIVIPIFYSIDPSDVRKQQGTYALAFAKLEEHFKDSMDDSVLKWKVALEEAANMSGFHDSSKTGTEADFVEEVAQDVLTKLNRESSSDLKGIWGMGGIGKTTLADAVFHRHSSKFEAACFLANVRENSEQTNGLLQLRNKLVGEILKQKDVNIDTPSIPPHIQDRFRRTKALIVLDDVNAEKQLEVLVGDDDRFCQGSRIIITARDKGLLEQKVDPAKIFSVEGLGAEEALQLFHSHAFGNKSPTTDYTELSRVVVDYIKGIPLALKVMGSSFHLCKSKQEWEVQWKKVKQFPNEEIDQVLRISYDGLGKNEKDIFLDIACFHKGYMRNDVERMLDSCDFFGEIGINYLIDRSLISISKEGWSKGKIEMHDLVQEMGRAIAREQGSRLFIEEDVYQVLTNNQSDGHVQAISFDWLEMEYANFEKMHQLRWLRVDFLHYLATPLIGSLGLPNSLRYLHLRGYPLKSLPSKFSAQNLVVLEMSYSNVGGQLWNEDQSPVNLKWINLSDCNITKVPDLSQSLKIEHIDLSSCGSLVEIPSYFQRLRKLTYLDLEQCTNLKNLPEMPCNLEFLNLYGTAIEELPSSVWSHEKISDLNIAYCEHLKSLPSNTCKLKFSLSLVRCISLCEFWELPRDTTELALSRSTIKELRNASIVSAVGLTAIKLINCESFVSLPTNIWKLKSLESIDLSWCSNFQYFPEILEPMEHLEFLNLTGTSVKELPPSIRNLVALQELHLHNCKNLEVVPDELFCLTSLQVLNLSFTKIKSLPASIKQAAQLSNLFLNHCKSLESLPELPPSLKTIGSDKCRFSRGLQGKHIKVLPTNKKCLESIDLSWCSKFQYFPGILKPMEHLGFLNLTGTAVKELPPSIRNLVVLRELDLCFCKNLEVVPDDLFCLTSLEELDLSSTEIKSIPASVKQAAKLSRLFLNDCKSLESLPELPPSLQRLEANGCTSLKTVSSSSTALAQGWEKYQFSQWLHEKHIFSDCRRLDENARSNIMGDAQLKIMRMATASSKFKEDIIEEASYDSDEESFVGIRCSGNEIPKWFSHKSEGCSIKIVLPPDWFSTDFLGFALSLVVVGDTHCMNIGCKYNFKTSDGESLIINHPLCSLEPKNGELFSCDEVFVWWYDNVFEVVEEAQSPTAFYKLVTEVNLDFTVRSYGSSYSRPEVEKCGICLLYGKDVEMIKQRAL